MKAYFNGDGHAWRFVGAQWPESLPQGVDVAHEAFVRRMQALLEAGDYQRARRELEESAEARLIHEGLVQGALHAIDLVVVTDIADAAALVDIGLMVRDDTFAERAALRLVAIKGYPLSSLYVLVSRIYAGRRRYREALMAATEAYQLDGASDDIACHLGVLYQNLGRPVTALSLFEAILGRTPCHLGALVNSGVSFQNMGRAHEAIARFARACELDHNNTVAHYNWIAALIGAGFTERASGLLARLKATDDASGQMVSTLRAQTMERDGMYEDALASLEPWIDKALYSQSLVVYGHVARRCSEAKAAMAADTIERWRAHHEGVTSPAEIRAILFALGSLYDRISDFDRAFECYKSANNLVPDRFDRQSVDDLLTSVRSFCARSALRREESYDETMIFVVGMPRSGTSLMAQILATDQNTGSAGEIATIGRIASELSGGVIARYPAMLEALSDPEIARYRRAYKESLGAASEFLRIVDKMPANFQFVGIIMRLFPNAKIIHMRRDWRDTCLSCYCQDFSGRHPYKYRLADLAYYYRVHESMMEAWKDLYVDKIITVGYEDLVFHFDQTTREVFQFVGLPWHEGARAFFRNKARCVTSSYQQVKEPIYTTSVGRWKMYEKHLTDLE